ncbi:early nodulin-like protein 18 [Miscanthus floridulus]|uniref:early nodulin-like protein 18 n=1 Tax=Miscanthus floridulus TaxID=154761 RepID=UPI003457E1BE
MPASPRTPPPSPPIPVFDLLVTPPLQSQALVKPILVYSRHRFHPSRLPAVRVEAAELAAPSPVSSPLPAAATASAPPPASSLVDPAVLGAGPLQAATTVLPPAATGEPSPSAAGVGVIQEALAPPLASSTETKIASLSSRIILSALGADFSDYVVVPSTGASGGILIAWRRHIGVSGV